ncbi:MAG: CPBP family intramembrane glutamic endopeptidase [Rubrobacteraceae bacterium]
MRVSARFVRLAAVFYGALVLAAVLWNFFRGREPLSLGAPVVGIPLGLCVAVVTVSLGLVLYRVLPAMRKLAAELAPEVVDGANKRDLVLVSIFSGVGEEAFFRGALQPEIGIVIASLVFGLVHIGPDRRYLVWTLWAVFAGFLFGGLYEVSGGVLAPAVAHASHNAATFLIWKRSRAGSVGDEQTRSPGL